MTIKKSELYSSLCASCDELRDGMDVSQYKDYDPKFTEADIKILVVEDKWLAAIAADIHSEMDGIDVKQRVRSDC